MVTSIKQLQENPEETEREMIRQSFEAIATNVAGEREDMVQCPIRRRIICTGPCKGQKLKCKD